MGRIAHLWSDIAESAEEGPDGLVLPPDAWERLRAEWSDEDIDEALGLVAASFLHLALVETADSLNAHLLDLLGSYGEAAAFHKVETGSAVLGVEVVGQLARRVARLEEVLETFRDGSPLDRSGFEALQRRLADHGIEEEMDPEDGIAEAAEGAGGEEEGEE
jgi:uncharacterized protein with von Willebrand factor type A (vWA) domain